MMKIIKSTLRTVLPAMALLATMTALAACSENEDIPVAKEVPQLPDWEDNISGEVYDYTVTMAPERPYMHRYDKTMVTKLFMSRPDGQGGSNVGLTFADALDVIKGLDNLSRGLPKIVYLIGWQYEGHDCKYPAFHQFNEALKRPEDATARESYLWLQQEAKKYNTTVSVHILLMDAYTDSPLWHEYVKNDYLCLDASGLFMQRAVYNGMPMYDVNICNEWQKGALQKRLDELAELANLADAKTVHFDAFFGRESPYHGTTVAQLETTMRKVLRYMRNHDIDVTAEFYHNNGERIDPMFGLQAGAWWMDLTSAERAVLPPTLVSGGREGLFGNNVWSEEAFLFGDNYPAEDDFNWVDLHPDRSWKTAWNSVKLGIATHSIPYMYFNCHKVIEYNSTNKTATYSDGLVADFKNLTVTHNGVLLRDHDNTFFPLPWVTDHKEIVAYSKNGYGKRRWTLPADWAGVTQVSISTVTSDGLENTYTLPVENNTVTLTLDANTMLSIQPE